MEEIVNLISQFGFPIACAIAAFWMYSQFVSAQMEQCAKREEALMQQSEVREEKLATQLDRFTETLNNFNVTLTKIDTRLEIIEKEVHKEQ